MILNENLYSIPKKIMQINTKNYTFNFSDEIAFFFKYSITACNISLLLIFTIFFLHMLAHFFFKKYVPVFVLIKACTLVLLIILITILVVKFYITLKIESILGDYLLTLKLDFFKTNAHLPNVELYTLFSSSFGDGVILLSVFVGIICLELIGAKNVFHTINNVSVFLLFIFFTIVMCSTTNLLVMFISFEFMFLPTVYFAYTLGYTKKIDAASRTLIYWTLLGSFLVLSNLGYLYYQYNTLNYLYLIQKKFSQQELFFLYLNFLLGFGVKIPLAPLHFWLLKIHVEAPTAFSIYLSGFLVKSALYCFYMFFLIFCNSYVYSYIVIWSVYSLIIGTLGLIRQVDVKKLIAWATIQEMSFILMFLLLKHLILIHTCVLFVLLHGLMSSYMFFLIDILQRRYKTRSLKAIRGVNIQFPELTKYVWFLILLFSGFPLTIKFFIEWALMAAAINMHMLILMSVVLTVNLIGIVFFCEKLFTILYGIPSKPAEDLEFFEILTKEKQILQLLLFLIVSLIILMYFI